MVRHLSFWKLPCFVVRHLSFWKFSCFVVRHLSFWKFPCFMVRHLSFWKYALLGLAVKLNWTPFLMNLPHFLLDLAKSSVNGHQLAGPSFCVCLSFCRVANNLIRRWKSVYVFVGWLCYVKGVSIFSCISCFPFKWQLFCKNIRCLFMWILELSSVGIYIFKTP